MSNNSKEFKIGRDAKTGEFIPVEKARQRPETNIVQVIPKRKPK
mgnify:CR=1 FL=1